MKPELIVALDVSSAQRAVDTVLALPSEVSWYKIGLELFCAEGHAVVGAVRAKGKSVFLDLKLHDIPRTVERAVRSVAAHGVQMVTIHASGGRAMIRAAADAARQCPGAPKILAVTVLTSLDQKDLTDLGVQRSPADHVVGLAELAIAAGADGVVCSPHEAQALRKKLGPEPLLVTPGIRLPSDAAGDQKRIATPATAARAGASHIVVGRPILEAASPAAAARMILEELATASPRA